MENKKGSKSKSTTSSKTKTKKASSSTKSSKAKTTKSNVKKPSDTILESKETVIESKETMNESKDSLSDEVECINNETTDVDNHDDVETKKETSNDTVKNDAPSVAAHKVFSNIAAFSWWKKIGYINILWTIGIIFMIMAFTWYNGKAFDIKNDKIIANIIFASILSAMGLIANITAIALYFKKRIMCYKENYKILTILLSLIPLGFIPILVFASLESKCFYSQEKVKSMGYLKPKFVMPHVYVILLAIIFLIVVASWIVTWTGTPSDTLAFEMYTNDGKGNITVIGSFAVILDDKGQWIIDSKKYETINSTLLTTIETSFNALESNLKSGLSVGEVKSAVSTAFANGVLSKFVKSSSSIAPAGFLYTLIAPIEGFVDAADLIIFLLIMGGFLAIVTEAQALEAGLGRMVKKMKGKEIILVPILFTLFSVGGATYGMAEETLPFYLLLIPVFLAAGFDTYTAFITILLGAGLGTMASILNPFVVNTAVSGSNLGDKLSPSNGIGFRSIIYVVLVILGATFCTVYAWRIKKNPTKSVIYSQKEEHEKHFSFDINSLPEFTWKRKLILAIFGITFLSMIISVISWGDIIGVNPFEEAAKWVDQYFPFLGGINKDGESLIGPWGTWYLNQMSFLFFLSSLVVAALSWKGTKHFIDKFMFGASDFIGVGIVIAISRGISKVVAATGLDNVIIDGISGLMKSIGNAYAIIVILFFLFFALSFLIPSTSGFAGAVFPLIGPAIVGSGIPGLSVSGAIATFSLTSGIVNISMPSGGIFMSALSLSRISIGTFYKQAKWFLLVLFIGSLGLLLIGQALNSEAGLDLF